MKQEYNPSEIEPKWQRVWEEKKAFQTPCDPKELKNKLKFYVLDMFPYPSGAGLHVGHPEGYTATDVIARLKRMQGYNVLHPMGWDAFGLPAERAAMRENLHPEEITKRNIANFTRQIKSLGFSYDWNREVNTSSPEYYRWTQWIFLKLYEKGLAYMADVPVNWCPALGTVLANEEVKDGKYVETGDPVERRLMKQWMLKITAYAERLLEDLDGLDWPEGVKEMQRNWIGKSSGAEVVFTMEKRKELSFTVFTTRPDTLFGATYCVLSPEHPLVSRITTRKQKKAVDEYVTAAKDKSDMARTDLAKEKTGIFTGSYTINPVTGEKLPVWVADYVLMSYGTGAIMAVPAHDSRDNEFARKFGLPIIQVIKGGTKPVTEEAHEGDGILINSGFLNGMNVEVSKNKMIEWLEQNKKGKGQVQYRLRDWLFSRQRYWGEPFPIIHKEDGTIVSVPAEDLPVLLPMIADPRPTDDGRPPLARAEENWLKVKLPDGTIGTRETNTMPQWAGSCWYYLRYLDPHNKNEFCSKEAEQYWMPVDLYVGGVEHAVLHLLYARFWHKVLYDCGVVHTKEPFQKLFNQGMILAYSYQDSKGKYYYPEQVEEKDGKHVVKGTTEALLVQIEKMSKSKYNVVNPDDVIREYGADSMRLYELFMGPLETTKPWQMDGVKGVYNFLCRVWRLVINSSTGELSEKLTSAEPSTENKLQKVLHQTIKKVMDDTSNMRFNTAIAQMMTFVNEATGSKTLPKEIMKAFLAVLAPYAPHLAEELWSRLGENSLISNRAWPKHDEKLCAEDEVTIVVQVNGKVRDKLTVAKGSDKKTLEELAIQSPGIQKYTQDKKIQKIIVVPDRLINILIE